MTQRDAEALVSRFLQLARRTEGRLGPNLDSFVFHQRERRFEAWWLPAIGHQLPGYVLMTMAGPVEAPPGIGAQQPEASGSAYRRAPGEAMSNPGPVVFRRETPNDRLGRRLGLNRTAVTGDESFDGAVYAETDAPEPLVQRLLEDLAAREGLLRCLRLGAEAVRLHASGELSVEVRGLDPALLLPQQFEVLVDSLGQAADGMPALQGPPLASSRPDTRKRASGLGSWRRGAAVRWGSWLAVPVLGLLATLSYSRWKPLDGAPLLWGLGAGLLAWVLALPLLRALLRGRPTSFRAFIASACAGLLAMPLGALALLLAINGALGPDQPERHTMRVSQRWVDRGSQAFGYYVTLRPMRPDAPALASVKIPWSTYRELPRGQLAVASFRRGRLGWLWGAQVTPQIERVGCYDP